MWILPAILAAFLLGMYDVFKKVSLNNNAVLPTLLFSVLTSSIIVLPVIIGSRLWPETFQQIQLYAPKVTVRELLLIFLKAVIVVASWIFAFFAVKNLPLTVVAPIRATAPLWTLIGALIIFQENLSTFQWIGIVITLVFFFLFSTTGKLEGINFKRNKYVFFIIAATFLGTISGLYDKYIIRNVDRIAVQVWFSVFQLVIMLPITALLWYPKRKKYTKFTWRWSIPLIGIFLLLCDYFYFYAISIPDSLISIISGVRRSGVLVAFIFGAMILKEKNIKQKGIYLIGIIVGVFLMALGS